MKPIKQQKKICPYCRITYSGYVCPECDGGDFVI
jgi:RNA polymerase subunit RPABC4/transcription elongation factor Spt4